MQKFQTRLKELWEKVKDFFKKLNKKMRILLGVCLVVILAAAIVLAFMVAFAAMYSFDKLKQILESIARNQS